VSKADAGATDDTAEEEEEEGGETATEETKQEETNTDNTTNDANGTATAETPAPATPSAADTAATATEIATAAAAALPPGVPAPGDPSAPVYASPATTAATMTASGPVAAPVPAPVMDAAALAQVLVEERGEVSALYVGRVIGKGGEMIRDLQARSGCRIDVDQSVPPGQPRIITYRGTQKTVDFAKQLVNLLCQENVNESDLPLGEAKREYMAVPATSVGKIIGRGGEMIRELQSRSHAKIQVDHNNAGATGLPATQKQLTITGTDLSVLKAKEMVNFLVANPMVDAMQGLNMLVEDKLHRGGQWGSGPPYLNLPNMGQNMTPDMVRTPYGAPGGYDPSGGGYGAAAPAYGAPMAPQGYGAAAGVPPVAQGGMPYGAPPVGGAGGAQDQEMIYVAKTYMGRLIGQKGVTINDLQRRSGSDIQINQDVPHGQDCEVTIRGGRQSIELAKQMIREIIEIGPNHPYAGGARTSYFIYCLSLLIALSIIHIFFTCYSFQKPLLFKEDMVRKTPTDKDYRAKEVTTVGGLLLITVAINKANSPHMAKPTGNNSMHLSSTRMDNLSSSNPCTVVLLPMEAACNSRRSRRMGVIRHRHSLPPRRMQVPGRLPQQVMGKSTTTMKRPGKRSGTSLRVCPKHLFGALVAGMDGTSDWSQEVKMESTRSQVCVKKSRFCVQVSVKALPAMA